VRIGFDAKRATHNFRGLGNYSRGLIEGLDKYAPNHQLILYTPPYNDPRAISWINNHQNLNVHIPNSFIAKNFPSIWRSFFLEREFSNDKLDIYHGLSHEIPKLKTNRSFKVAVTIHDLIFLRFPEYFPKIDRMVYLNKFKYSTQNSDLIIAICEQTKSDLINFLNVKEEKIIVHYQSVSPNFSQEKSQQEIEHFKKNHLLNRPYILNVGAFEERKNQKSLIEAFNLIRHEIEHDLVLIGNGKKYLHEVREQISIYKLEDRVKIFTNFPFHSLPLIYQGASLFCFPSHFEGFGIPIVEALFSKVPVITSVGSCFPESAGPDSEYCNPNDVESIAQSIRCVLMDQKRQLHMKSQGHLYSERFSQENSTRELVKLYSQLM
jgi:glycosyltransferase involved in cell wall biosynthesis